MAEESRDWDDAYANGAYIPGAADYPPRWIAAATAFKDKMGGRHSVIRYGAGERNLVDLFRPLGTPKGLAVFVHGGYWMRFDPSYWLHLAAGAMDRGWAVGLPTYTLAPEIRISEITQEIGQALASAAEQIDGPIHLAGHSAGGHLVSRMACVDAPLPEAVAERVARVLSISGVHDLRPLRRTALNHTLGITAAEAEAESPCLLIPREGTDLVCWVGADERPEFIRQNALLANVWTGFDTITLAVEDPGKHHFDVIDGLADAESPIMQAWME
ncbi:MAG: alpha/beta hydrolase [Pseudomonadota bacterium]